MESKKKSKAKAKDVKVKEEKDTSKIFFNNLDKVLHESMMPYSEHVILDRALPS